MMNLYKAMGLYYAFGQLDAQVTTMDRNLRAQIDPNIFSDIFAQYHTDVQNGTARFAPSVQDAWRDYLAGL